MLSQPTVDKEYEEGGEQIVPDYNSFCIPHQMHILKCITISIGARLNNRCLNVSTCKNIF